MKVPGSNARSSSSRLLAAACIATLAWPTGAGARPTSARPSKDRAAQEQAAALSQVAAAKNEAGDFALCADLYHQAYRTDPTFLGYLFSAARCEQKAGALDAAERDYRQFLARAPSNDALAGKARQFLDEIFAERRKPRAAVAPASVARPAAVDPPAAVTAVQAPATPPDVGPSKVLAWAVAGGGGALAVVGALLVADGLSQRAALQADVALPNGGVIVALTPAQARDREAAYRARVGLGAGIAGVGVAAVATGVWLMLRRPDAVAVAPTLWPAPVGRGATLGVGVTLGWR